MTFTGDLIAENVHVPREDWRSKLTTSSRSGVDFSPKQPKTDIVVNWGIIASDSTPVKISYKSDGKPVEWIKIHSSLGNPSWSEGGTVNLTFAWNSSGKWEGGTEEHPNSLQLKFTNDKKWDIGMTAETPEWWERFLGKTDRVPVGWENIKVPVPNLDFSLKALDYFMVTNLLFPGQHIFQAHPPAADDSKKTGLASPRDFILTGNINTSPKAPMISN